MIEFTLIDEVDRLTIFLNIDVICIGAILIKQAGIKNEI